MKASFILSTIFLGAALAVSSEPSSTSTKLSPCKRKPSSSASTSTSAPTSISTLKTTTATSTLKTTTSSTATRNPSCNADNCARAVTGTLLGAATQSAHKSDCSSFLQCTVFPATSTVTATATAYPTTQTVTVYPQTAVDVLTYTTLASTVATLVEVQTVVETSVAQIIETDISVLTQTAPVANKARSAPALTQAATGSTVCPSSVPTYASACSGAVRFSSACSCYGVSKTLTTATTPTTTVTVTAIGQSTVTVSATTIITSSVAAVTPVTAITTLSSTIVDVVTAVSTVVQTSIVTVSPPAPSGNAYCANGRAVNGLSATCAAVGCSPVNLRIEGASETVYEGVILNGPRSITTSSGGTHLCDGTNNNANPAPFANGISSIDAAAGLCGFGYDGTYSAQFEDFFIQTIGASSSVNSGNQFWGILNNYAFTPTGGCETEVLPTDELLWAFNAFNVNFFLRVQPTQTPVVLSPGQTMTFTVQGSEGGFGSFQPIPGASFAGGLSDANGNVQITAPSTPGTYRYKATRSDSIRSNAVTIVVQ